MYFSGGWKKVKVSVVVYDKVYTWLKKVTDLFIFIGIVFPFGSEK